MTQPRGTVGASDVAALFNESPFQSRYSLWARECGLLTEEEDEDTERLKSGRLFERPILQIWADREFPNNHGVHVVHNIESFKVGDGSSATPDGLFVLSIPTDHPIATVQVKTVQPHERRDWLAGTPRYYWWQVQQEMRALRTRQAYMVAAFGFAEISHEVIDADDAAHEQLAAEIKRFWAQVRGEEEPPSPDSHRATLAALMAQPRERKTIQLDSNAAAVHERIRAWSGQLNEAKRELKKAKAEMLALLGGADAGVFVNGTGYRVEQRSRAAFMSKATKFKQLVAFTSDETEEGEEDND